MRLELEKVVGIGQWAADIYLLMALQQPEDWARGVFALHKAFTDLKALKINLATSEFERYGEPWRSWRSVSTRILSNHYLSPPPPGPTR